MIGSFALSATGMDTLLLTEEESILPAPKL